MNKGPFYVLFCYILWGVLPVFWKLLAEVSSFYVLANRIFWSMVFVAVVLLCGKHFPQIKATFRDRKELLRLILNGVLVGANWGAYIWSVNNGHLLDASLAYYMNPILAILLGNLVFREKLTKLQWLSVVMTLTGIVIVSVRHGEVPWLSILIAGTFAIYGAVKKGVCSPAGVSVFFETLTLAPLALVFMLWADANGTGAVGILHGWQWLLLPLSGIVTTVPLLSFAKGVRTTPMTLTGLLMYVNPTLQFLLSVWLFHEEFTASYAILFAFVWTGVALYLLSDLQQHRKEKLAKA